MSEPRIDSLHDPFEDQLSAARYKAERDAAVQELSKLRGEATTMSAYDLLPEADLETLRWVREQGGLDVIKTHTELFYQLKDERDWYRHKCRVCEKRPMPEGVKWPQFEDGMLVMFGDETTMTEAVETITFSAGGTTFIGDKHGDFEIEHGERVKRPAAPAGDGEPLEVGQTVWLVGDDGAVKLECEVIDPNGGAGEFSVMVREVGKYGYSYVRPSSLIHAKPEPPDSWERIEEDLGDEMAKQQCGPISPELACKLAGEFVRRCQALAEWGE